MIKKGAQLEVENDHGNTPLYISLLNNHMNMAISLLQMEAQIKKKVAVYTPSILRSQLKKKLDLEKLQKEKEEAEAIKAKIQTGMEIEGKNTDDKLSESEASIIESDSEKEEKEEEDEEEAPHQYSFNHYNAKKPAHFRAKVARSARPARPWGHHQQEEDDENEETTDSCDLGKAGELISPFMVAIKRNWQGLSFLMLESGFEISLAVLDCFKANKLNYVYTLLLKKEEGGFY
jgi:hypothetical protein